jgi:7,8-dihydropterin-6-yl-methyl-4-(beta-D-ribofuranosyl)aminobenzene 5'-phosphate synthase
MLRAIELINAAKASDASLSNERNVIVDLHPNRPDFRGVTLPDFQMSLEADPTFAEISDAGGNVSKNADTHTVLDDFFLISGEIPRVTTYETGLRRGARFVEERGGWEKDELILDERFVICKLKGHYFLPFPLPPNLQHI